MKNLLIGLMVALFAIGNAFADREAKINMYSYTAGDNLILYVDHGASYEIELDNDGHFIWDGEKSDIQFPNSYNAGYEAGYAKGSSDEDKTYAKGLSVGGKVSITDLYNTLVDHGYRGPALETETAVKDYIIQINDEYVSLQDQIKSAQSEANQWKLTCIEMVQQFGIDQDQAEAGCQDQFNKDN